MHKPSSLQFVSFESKDNPLTEAQNTLQAEYLKDYLKNLDVKKILIESNYFDRDYLSEFSAFYSTSVSGYQNICKRIHFFSDKNIDRKLFEKATGGEPKAIKILNNSYLGFCVLRPIKARLGKTVLKWYDNKQLSSQRITVKRTYKCHVAGVQLEIKGLAWQQQDTGVGACATIALWSALQSSAFDDFHAIPTTTEITRAANKTMALGSKTFPSKGLTSLQLYEAIKELGLSPMVQKGNLDIGLDQKKYFTKERFMNSIASYIRSDYPVIILGHLKIEGQYTGEHAISAVGFRNDLNPKKPAKILTLEDSLNEILYIHDDNIGPNARFKISEEKIKGTGYTIIDRNAPSYSSFKEPKKYQIIPHTLVVATHNELRSSPNELYKKGLKNVAIPFEKIFKDYLISFSLGVRFIKLTDYIHKELDRLLRDNPKKLSQLRLKLWEQVRPMSLHLGLVRIGLTNSFIPLLDVLYDTTDSHLQPFTYISYDFKVDKIIELYNLNFSR